MHCFQDIISKDPETHGSLFVPVILGSDKTTVSVATGHSEYWPLYASIGNIHNNVRRAHGSGLVLVAFLAIPKSKRSNLIRPNLYL
jgi:Plavaka transposase